MTEIKPCACIKVEEFEVKSAGAKSRSNIRPRQSVPWFSQTAGAQYQDARYGKGMRLHNLGGKGSVKTSTCTVCGKNTQV